MLFVFRVNYNNFPQVFKKLSNKFLIKFEILSQFILISLSMELIVKKITKQKYIWIIFMNFKKNLVRNFFYIISIFYVIILTYFYQLKRFVIILLNLKSIW